MCHTTASLWICLFSSHSALSVEWSKSRLFTLTLFSLFPSVLWNSLPFVPLKRQQTRRFRKHSEENRTPKRVCICMPLSASQAAFIWQHLFSFHCLFSPALCRKACRGMYLWLKLHIEKCVGVKGLGKALEQEEKKHEEGSSTPVSQFHPICSVFLLLLGYFWDPLVSVSFSWFASVRIASRSKQWERGKLGAGAFHLFHESESSGSALLCSSWVAGGIMSFFCKLTSENNRTLDRF